MSNAKFRNEFNNEKRLYVAEPLVRGTESWLSFDDVDDNQKARTLYFSELEGKDLYIAFVRKDNKTYAKLYITDARYIRIVYVRSYAVNPVQRYFVTKKKT